MSDTELDRRVRAMRRFSRFYTARIGALREGLNDGPFGLTEGRVMYELVHRDGLAASDLVRELGLDAGYLSRILSKLVRQGVVERLRSVEDGRRQVLAVTRAGRRVFAPVERASQNELRAMLGQVAEPDQRRLLEAMDTIERVLGGNREPAAYVLRPHRIGDMGWVVSRHGTLYAEEFGWNHEFEGLVAEIASKFIREFDPAHERSVIAEKDGRPVGCAFVVRDSARVARLRLVLVEPQTRGSGLGRMLVRECERFAREKGYRKMTLWTHDVLVAARAIYASEGYRLVEEERYHKFGKDLIGETWEKALV
ncbi:MAG: GNAT family N-acetyltransferase [Alphaproteobacteria bacterium]|nr:GNAT family N-acetyltransferase [Alphaproteobacteria bacterium]MCW5742489.1 GNAT family N-acetyltransferase [Alphaproteobacteria bacterium]